MAVEREVVGGGAGVEHRAAVLHVRHVVDGGLGEAKEAWRTEPVVEIFVPLVSEQPLEEPRALARLELRDIGIAPEKEVARQMVPVGATLARYPPSRP